MDEGWQCVSPETQYLYALYWSIATVTSIGYGDIVATPLHTVEQVVCVCMMLIGSLLFAYLVGSFCGLAANLSPDVMRFRQDLTDLNKFLSTANIPNSLRYELREYMHHGQALRRAQTAKRLLGDFAPKLRNEVALQLNEKWLRRVALLNNECEDGVVLELAFALKLHIFPPGESCPIGSIYIVTRGAALFAGRAYVSGGSWGEADALLETDRLRFPIPAWAISYLFAYSIDGESLRHTMSQVKYPEAYARMRTKQVSWIVRRGIVRLAEEKVALLESGGTMKLRTSIRGSLMMQRSPFYKPSSKLADIVSCAQQHKQAMKLASFEKETGRNRRKGRISKERLNRAARMSDESIPHVDPVNATSRQLSTRLHPTPIGTVPFNGQRPGSPNGLSVASLESHATGEHVDELRRVAGEVRVIQKGMAEMQATVSGLRTAQNRDMGIVQALLKQLLVAQSGQLGPLGSVNASWGSVNV